MISRSIEHWRSLPHLRISECAEIAGVCERTIEAALPQMETRTIGRIRFVTTASFRRWLGETVEEPVAMAPSSTRVRQHVARVMRGMA